MLRSLYSGISGLRAHQTMLDVTGNNIANVNTTGFKSLARRSSRTPCPRPSPAAGAPQADQGGHQPGPGRPRRPGRRRSPRTSPRAQRRPPASTTDMMISGDGFFVEQRRRPEALHPRRRLRLGRPGPAGRRPTAASSRAGPRPTAVINTGGAPGDDQPADRARSLPRPPPRRRRHRQPRLRRGGRRPRSMRDDQVYDKDGARKHADAHVHAGRHGAWDSRHDDGSGTPVTGDTCSCTNGEGHRHGHQPDADDHRRHRHRPDRPSPASPA